MQPRICCLSSVKGRHPNWFMSTETTHPFYRTCSKSRYIVLGGPGLALRPVHGEAFGGRVLGRLILNA